MIIETFAIITGAVFLQPRLLLGEHMEFEGYVSRIVYQNSENGYSVIALELTGQAAEEAGEEQVAVGTFPGIEKGDFIKITGEWVKHSSYGMQIKASSFSRAVPADIEAIKKYLSSGAIKGIGMKMAERIVEKFGEDSLRVIEEEPATLAKVKGISDKKAAEIAQAAAEKKNLRDAMMFLQQYGISLNMAVKIYNTYELEIYDLMRNNPYKLATDIEGIGFKTADAIAERAGISKNSEFRIKAGIIYVLKQAGGSGHTYLPKEVLKNAAAEMLEVSDEEIEKNLMDLQISRQLISKNVRQPGGTEVTQVYETMLYYMELNVADRLLSLSLEDSSGAGEAERLLADFERSCGMSLDDEQKNAVVTAVTHGLTLITGGPGTGKTTTINALLYCFERLDISVSLAAPTGRAARRMKEASGHEAQTLHRLLEVSGNPEGGGVRFMRDDENPLEADAIIVDETSMVDIYLMNALLKAIVPGTRLILVGDKDQLPSVGPGNVLKDIIAARVFPVVYLKTIFRQAAQSDIIVNAHKINKGEIVEPRTGSKDFLFVHRDDADRVIAATITLVKDKLPAYVNADIRDIQVLTPMRKGVLGVEKLNIALQQALNPPAPGKAEKETAFGVFREGDKVMQVKNDYDKEWEILNMFGVPAKKGIGVFNGDLGIVKSLNHYAEEAEIEFDEGRTAIYSYKEFEELELAYAVTIHKAQGSEYPAVVLPILTGPRPLMNRNLLYTAVTRAKSCVTVVGSLASFQDMIRNTLEDRRYSGLKDRITESVGGYI